MKKIIVGFQVYQDFKQRIIEAGKKYEIDGVNNPVNLSMFCRIAVAKLVSEVEEKGEIKQWEKNGVKKNLHILPNRYQKLKEIIFGNGQASYQ